MFPNGRLIFELFDGGRCCKIDFFVKLRSAKVAIKNKDSQIAVLIRDAFYLRSILLLERRTSF